MKTEYIYSCFRCSQQVPRCSQQPEGTWDNYETKPKSFIVLNDGKNAKIENPLFTGKIFSLQEYSVKAIVVYRREANLYAFKP